MININIMIYNYYIYYLFILLLMGINGLPLDWIVIVICYFQNLGSLANKKKILQSSSTLYPPVFFFSGGTR